MSKVWFSSSSGNLSWNVGARGPSICSTGLVLTKACQWPRSRLERCCTEDASATFMAAGVSGAQTPFRAPEVVLQRQHRIPLEASNCKMPCGRVDLMPARQVYGQISPQRKIGPAFVADKIFRLNRIDGNGLLLPHLKVTLKATMRFLNKANSPA